MCESAILQIRESIELAQQQEARTHDLQNYLQALIPQLHRAIDLPEQNPSGALLQFVVDYIRQVPDVLETLTRFMNEAGIAQQGEVFVQIALDFFLKPPEMIQNHTGLQALIDEAYLAHRLMEEVNDRLLLLNGVPLTPLDMTLPNIIVHDLLGEDFANQLDLAVHYAIEALFPSNATHPPTEQVLSAGARQHWQELLKRWPGLAGDGDIAIRLPGDDKPSMH